MGRVLRLYIAESWNNLENISLHWNCTNVLKFLTQGRINPHRTKANQYQFQSSTNIPHTFTYVTSLALGLRGISQSFSTSFNLINIRKKRLNLKIRKRPYFVQLNREQKELVYQVDKANKCGQQSGSLPTNGGWRDTSFALWDFSQSSKQCVHLSTSPPYSFALPHDFLCSDSNC